MSDEVTVRLTDDGPVRYSGGGIMVDRGDEVETNRDHAAFLVDNHGFEWVGCECSTPAGCDVLGCETERSEPTCAGNGGECSRPVDEPGGYCWQHGGD